MIVQDQEAQGPTVSSYIGAWDSERLSRAATYYSQLKDSNPPDHMSNSLKLSQIASLFARPKDSIFQPGFG
jgi:hypothetical protein